MISLKTKNESKKLAKLKAEQKKNKEELTSNKSDETSNATTENN